MAIPGFIFLRFAGWLTGAYLGVKLYELLYQESASSTIVYHGMVPPAKGPSPAVPSKALTDPFYIGPVDAVTSQIVKQDQWKQTAINQPFSNDPISKLLNVMGSVATGSAIGIDTLSKEGAVSQLIGQYKWWIVGGVAGYFLFIKQYPEDSPARGLERRIYKYKAKKGKKRSDPIWA